jgi:glycosyltransferase involved in cell wall biosynthesis
LKILFINPLYASKDNGGAEIILQTHAEAMRKRGHSVSVLSLGDTGMAWAEEINGVKVRRVRIKNIYWPFGGVQASAWKRTLWHLFDIYNPLTKPVIAEVVKSEQPDLVCVHNLPGWSVSVWSVLERLNIPIVQVLHDPYLICPRSNMFHKDKPCQQQCLKCRLMRKFHPRLSKKVTAVVGVSQFILGKLIRLGYFEDVPIREVINNARQMNAAAQARGTEPESNGLITFGFIGRLLSSKGIEFLLDSFIRHSPESWRLVVAGSGKLEYESYLKAKFGHDRVSFIGSVPPEDFFGRIDFTVVPSLWEDTFPGVVFESFFYGVPVLGSNRGGIPEMIQEGVNGVLFDPDVCGSLQALMSEVAVNKDYWQSSAQKIIEMSHLFFDSEAWTDKWEDLYTRVLELPVQRR